MKSLGFLKIEDQHLLQCAKLAHDMVFKHCPENLQGNLNLTADSHSHTLRSVTSNPLIVREDRTATKEMKARFSRMGPKVWNGVPETLKKIKSRFSFKKNLREHILNGYAEKLTCSNPLCQDRRFHLH